MPGPRWLARFNRYGTNRVLGPLAPILPWFGVIEHVGRTSGRKYHTPVNIFSRPGGYVVALTYGPRSEWVRNVLAHGGCGVVTRGKYVRLVHPRVFHDELRQGVPAVVSIALSVLNVADFLDLSVPQ